MIAKMWDAVRNRLSRHRRPGDAPFKKNATTTIATGLNDAHTRLFEETMEVVYPDWQRRCTAKRFCAGWMPILLVWNGRTSRALKRR
jgi:hypothetical protein